MNLHNRDIDHEEVLQLRDLAVFRRLDHAAVVAQRRSWQQQSMQSAQLWELDCLLHECTENCTTCQPNIDHLVNVLQRKNLYVFLKRGTIGICLCATTGMSTACKPELCTTLHNNGHVNNRSKNGTWRISTVSAQFALWVHVLHA